ncbi:MULTISPECIES: NTP/NDP exchange transporter [unclassified Endozoicomonas]|uniref:NTP/NDP exchange transporter n=2 Tax=Endozoicomonas TaxID=305899 RepID=UPI0021482A3F|nr:MULTISPECIES: NTP/NDP exchange transporter [unclassified Endozoicomonas]
MSDNTEFSKWRGRLWPVYVFELKKLIPMILMFYLILFNYTILRDTKDTLVVTGAGSGAEIIPFLKLWVNVPFAIIFTITYAKLSNVFKRSSLFYLVVSSFLSFFCFFALVLYPAREVLHPTEFADYLQSILPSGFMGLIAVMRNWTFSLFYVMSELWGSVCLSLLFWGFANHINRISESKRFYALFGMMGNLALPTAGLFVYYASQARGNLAEGIDPWQHSLNLMTGVLTIGGILIMVIYWWINRYVLTDSRLYQPDDIVASSKEKLSLSLKESFLHIIHSKYLFCIALLVISYGVCINMVEVTWKHQLRMQYPNPNEYNQFMGLFSTCTGIVTILMMLFFTNNVIRRFGWTVAALCTPVVLLITGSLFFCFVLFRDVVPDILFLTLGITPLMLTVILGGIQNIMSKSTKYSLFDPTKEMSYIPLDPEEKVKGKAAVDVIGNPTGKSTGSIIQQVLIISLGSLVAIAPYVAVIVLLFFAIWIGAARSLGRQFNALSSAQKKSSKADHAADQNSQTSSVQQVGSG